MQRHEDGMICGAYCGALILAAMAAQTCCIIFLSLLRETVKHKQAFEQMIEGKLLGTITHERPHVPFKKRLLRKKDSLLIDSAFSSLRFSEDYQKLATKLEYLKKNQNAAMFAITSVAENEGKSTIAANLALALSERGYRVVLMDLDLRKPSLYKIFGYHANLEQEFSDVLSGKISAQDYRFLQYKNRGLFLALSKRYRQDVADWLGSDRMKACLSDIRSKTDFVMIDTPPTSASADAAGLVRIADRAILAVRTDRTAAADIRQELNQACIGVLPQVAFKRHKRKIDTNILLTNPAVGGTFLESIRLLRDAVQNGLQGNENVIVITSTAPEEGKSVITLNLAAMLGKNDKKVLVVDADLRNSGISKLLHMDRAKPAAGETEKKAAALYHILNYAPLGIDVLTFDTQAHHLRRIIRTDQMREIVDSLRTQYDLILIDTPPCGMISDAAIIAGAADAAVYVVRQDTVLTSRIRDGINAHGTVQRPRLSCDPRCTGH